MQPLFIIRYSLNSENAMFTASELLERINSHIAELQFTRTPQGLYAPVTYVLSMGGKRIRPVLMLMAYNLYQEDITRIFNPATGIEVYHNYTLLHDDLMDRADRRRGKETVHKVWDDNAAILSGDAMLVLAYQFMAQCPVECLKEVMDIFSLTALEICEGQQLDMEFEHRKDVKAEEYLEMMKILVIDGQGGGVGKTLITFIRQSGIAIQTRFGLQLQKFIRELVILPVAHDRIIIPVVGDICFGQGFNQILHAKNLVFIHTHRCAPPFLKWS